MKKKIEILLITLILMSFNVSTASADITSVRSRASLNVGVFTGKNEGLLYDGGNLKGTGIRGARITMTDKNGNKLSGSKTFEIYYSQNYVTSGATAMNNYANLHFYNKNKTNKKAVFGKDYEWGTYTQSNISSIFASNGFTITVDGAPVENVASLGSNQEIKDYFERLSQSITDEWEIKASYEITKKVLKKFGLNEDLLESDLGNYKNGIYIVIEPITSYLFGNDYAKLAEEEYLVTSGCDTNNCLQSSKLPTLNEYETNNKALIDTYFSIANVNVYNLNEAEKYYNKYLSSKTNTANVNIYNDFWGNTSDETNSAIYNWCEQSVEERYNTLKTFDKIDNLVNDVYSKPKWKAFCRTYPIRYAGNNNLYANKYAILAPYKNSIVAAYEKYSEQHDKLERAIKAAEGIFYFTGTPSEAYQFNKTWKTTVRDKLENYCKTTYLKDDCNAYINSINNFPAFANVNSFGLMTVDPNKKDVENLTYGKNHCNSDYSNYATETAGCGIMAISVVAKDSNGKDSCDELVYNRIISGENLTNEITIAGEKRNLQYCCSYDVYNTAFKNKYDLTTFEKNVAKFCPTTNKNKCGVSEYNYIEENGNSILKNDIPGLTVIDKTTGKERQAKYEDCCTADYYDLPLKDGKTKITKDDIDFLNENFCKQKQCGVDEIKSLLGLSPDDPNKLNALECCNISAFEGNEEFLNSTIKINNKNKVVKTLFDSESGILKNAEKYCPITSGVCTFSDTIAKGIRYKNGVEKAENDCCNWNNYGNTTQEKIKNSAITYSNVTKIFDSADSFTKFIVSIPEYSKVCPNTKCTTTDLQNILSGIETDKEKIEKCCVKTGYDNITLNSKIGDKLVSSFFTKDGGTKLNSRLCPSDYCTLESVAEGNTECCTKPVGSGLSAYSKEDKLKYSTESGLETALINYLGKQEYYRLCKTDKDCYYDVDGNCPNCDSDLHSSGETTDLVRGEDSTKLDVGTEIKDCIVKNSDYLSSTNDLSSKYCKVYCTQKVEYNYPKKSTLNVSAGRYILVGGSSGYTGVFAPIQVKTVMTCRVTDVAEAQFKTDLADAVDALKKAYKDYSNALIPLDNMDSGDKVLNTVQENKQSNAQCDCENRKSLGSKGVNSECCSNTNTATMSDKGKMNSTTITHYSYDYNSKTNCEKNGGTWISQSSNIVNGCIDCKSTCSSDCKSKGYEYYKYEQSCTKSVSGTLTKARCENAGGTYTGQCKCKETVAAHCSVTINSCGDSDYTKVGDKCVYSNTSNKDCKTVNGNVECKSYTCKDSLTNLVKSETGYLLSGNSIQGETNNPSCVYQYCSTRDYTRFKYQTVTSYKYGANLEEKQTERSKPQCEEICTNGTCTKNSNYYKTVFETKKEKAYNDLIKARDHYYSVIDDYAKCFNIEKTISDYLDLNIDFKLSYKNSIYSVNVDLKKSPLVNNPEKDYELVDSKKYNQCVLSTDLKKLNCESRILSEARDTSSKVQVFKKMNEINSIRIEKEYNYYLPDDADVYTSVNKSSKSKLSKEKEMNNFDIGKHLPVAYNEKDNDIEVTLTPTVTSNKLRSSEFKTKLCTNQYECTAKPDGDGCIIPVYRPIDLNDPFPDQDDKGRQTGVNWCASDSTGCSNTNTLVKKVITNNRGVTTNEVYKLTPLYTIRLTPSMISQIRDYNKDTTYGDYNLICDEGTGKHCISRYLRGEEDENGNVLKNNLKAIGAIIPSQSCALTENLNGCKPNDYYKTKID